jgi:Rad3-related DNA helicase
VWISTYTRALQRQIERESHSIYPDPLVRARKAVVRKGRENYMCLLNFQEQVNTAQLGNGDLIGLALAARWARASRDGDMTGGDFPAWLPTLFAIRPRSRPGRPTWSTDAASASTPAASTIASASSRRPCAPPSGPTSSSPTTPWC